MSDRSAIEWTDATWNPVRGCTKVSPGCKFCYAEVFSERFRGVPGHPFERGFRILAFAERVLPRAADLWVQASLEQRQRFQQLFFPEGIAFDGKAFVGTRVTAPAFSYLRPIEDGNEGVVAQIFTSWNPLMSWVRGIGAYRAAA